MKQLIGGRIAVLYTPNSPQGWFTAHNKTELLFDPKIIKMVLDGTESHHIHDYCYSAYGDLNYSSIKDLSVEYITPGDKFIVVKGLKGESFLKSSEFDWIEAS